MCQSQYLSVTSHFICIVTRCLSHGMLLYLVMMMLHFLNDVANDAESTQKIENYVIIASLKSETMGKLINRTSGSHFMISSLPFDIKFTRLGFDNAC